MNNSRRWTEDIASVFSVESPATITRLDSAVAALSTVLDATALELPSPDLILLSGGVDSMLVALAAVRAGYSPLCVTAITDEDDPQLDGVWARAAAEYLGLDWEPVLITASNIRPLINLAISRIRGRGLYNVASAVVDIAIAEMIRPHGFTTAWTGGWADILFGPYPDVRDPDGPPRLDRSGRLELLQRSYAVDDENKYAGVSAAFEQIGLNDISFFDTAECVHLASLLDPSVLSVVTDEKVVTKAPLRALAERWGLPTELAYQPKRALQDSSGVFSLMAECARADEMATCDDFTTHEPRRHGRDAGIMTAYWLQLLS